MARPTPNNPTGAQKSPKLTEETIKKLEEAFAIDASVGEACFYADISHQTYYNWVKDSPELFDRLNRLREKPILVARQTIAKNLSQPEHAKWYLERKKKLEFGAKEDPSLALSNVVINVLNYSANGNHTSTPISTPPLPDTSSESS